MKESIIYPHTRVPKNVVEDDEEQPEQEYEDEMYTSTRAPF
jgi:hypothetical protein